MLSGVANRVLGCRSYSTRTTNLLTKNDSSAIRDFLAMGMAIGSAYNIRESWRNMNEAMKYHQISELEYHYGFAAREHAFNAASSALFGLIACRRYFVPTFIVSGLTQVVSGVYANVANESSCKR